MFIKYESTAEKVGLKNKGLFSRLKTRSTVTSWIPYCSCHETERCQITWSIITHPLHLRLGPENRFQIRTGSELPVPTILFKKINFGICSISKKCPSPLALVSVKCAYAAAPVQSWMFSFFSRHNRQRYSAPLGLHMDICFLWQCKRTLYETV